MIQQRPPHPKIPYTILLVLLGIGTFGLFSDMELNFFVKSYAMLLLLAGGWALLYFGVYLKGLRKK
ncbi:hypothetical protein [Oscillatoria sp. FACHB-1406]|uniref:hypothetical protein n=1 Tax=Oscillatoria sp. FACHB-1406 TaxID=2692846 RepID=UPI001689FC53|nr:hypothetical protein [Oscillatoria sp. FACHB-1406]MBD2578815.1 hypothetical protein [Oscillatoria sp. FACHB-1406]